MKKIILSAVILVSVCISANAQFNFGIKAGVNSSTISSSDLKTSSVTGLQGGVFFRFGKRFFVQPELYVSSTGGSFTSQDNAYSATARFTNMSLPLLLGVALGAKSTKFRIFAGPVYTAAFGYTLSNTRNPIYNDFGAYNKSIYNYQAGVGIDLGLITADVRYEGAFSDVYANYSQKQELWALNIGFRFF